MFADFFVFQFNCKHVYSCYVYMCLGCISFSRHFLHIQAKLLIFLKKNMWR